MVDFDVQYVFEVVGGPSALLALINVHLPDAKLAYPTVQMWKQRDQISSEWIARVIYVMIRHKIDPLTLYYDAGELTA
jgi:LPS sulfotransferase NodH